MAPKRARVPKAPKAPKASKEAKVSKPRQKAPPLLRFRDNVGKMALGMQNEGDIALEHMATLTESLPQCTVAHYTIVELVDMFVDGKLNLDPNGQRNLVVTRAYVVSFAKTILQTSLGIPSIVLNKRDDGSCDVVDGKQRIASMIALASGLVPSLGDAYIISSSIRPDWHFSSLLQSTHPTVVQCIEMIQSQVGKGPDGDIDVVDDVMRTRFNTGRLLAQQYDNWPAVALAAASALYCIKTVTHTPNEILFQLDNPLCNLVRTYDADVARVLGTLCKNGPFNMHKAVFGDMLRGIACMLPNVSFIPKASNMFGYGQFMDNLVPLAMSEEAFNADTRKAITRACTSRLGRFVEYVRDQSIQFKSFKPDMIAILFFMLCVNFEPSGMCEMLFCMSEPKRDENNESDMTWITTEYKKTKNIHESFNSYKENALTENE